MSKPSSTMRGPGVALIRRFGAAPSPSRSWQGSLPRCHSPPFTFSKGHRASDTTCPSCDWTSSHSGRRSEPTIAVRSSACAIRKIRKSRSVIEFCIGQRLGRAASFRPFRRPPPRRASHWKMFLTGLSFQLAGPSVLQSGQKRTKNTLKQEIGCFASLSQIRMLALTSPFGAFYSAVARR